MAIVSTKTTTIPGSATPSTPDSLAFRLIVYPGFAPGGVTASASVSFQRYRCNDDGTAPIPIGEPITNPNFIFSDLFAAAANDPDLAAAVNAVMAFAQILATRQNI